MSWWTHTAGAKALSPVEFKPVETQQGSVHNFHTHRLWEDYKYHRRHRPDKCPNSHEEIQGDGWNQSCEQKDKFWRAENEGKWVKKQDKYSFDWRGPNRTTNTDWGKLVPASRESGFHHHWDAGPHWSVLMVWSSRPGLGPGPEVMHTQSGPVGIPTFFLFLKSIVHLERSGVTSSQCPTLVCSLRNFHPWLLD